MYPLTPELIEVNQDERLRRAERGRLARCARKSRTRPGS
jgi:hypothetical protein